MFTAQRLPPVLANWRTDNRRHQPVTRSSNRLGPERWIDEVLLPSGCDKRVAPVLPSLPSRADTQSRAYRDVRRAEFVTAMLTLGAP